MLHIAVKVAAGVGAGDLLALMNSAPGYMDIGQTLSSEQFSYLGPFSAVWFESW